MYTLLKTILLPALLLLTLSNSTTCPAETVRIDEVDYNNGIYYVNDRAFNGDIVDYYENEKLKFRYHVLDGRLNGSALEYFPNGEVKSLRNYSTSKLFGQFTEYHENGEVRASFEVKLNAYKTGEIVENITVGKLKNGRVKTRQYDKGVIYFLSDKGETFKSSEVISILHQTKYKITNEAGDKIWIEVD